MIGQNYFRKVSITSSSRITENEVKFYLNNSGNFKCLLLNHIKIVCIPLLRIPLSINLMCFPMESLKVTHSDFYLI